MIKNLPHSFHIRMTLVSVLMAVFISVSFASVDNQGVKEPSGPFDAVRTFFQRMTYADAERLSENEVWTSQEMLEAFVDDSRLLGDIRFDGFVPDESLDEQFAVRAQEAYRYKSLMADNEYDYASHRRQYEFLTHIRDKHRAAKDFRRQSAQQKMARKKWKLNRKIASDIQDVYSDTLEAQDDIITRRQSQASLMIHDSPGLLEIAKEDFERRKMNQELTPRMDVFRKIELRHLYEQRQAASARRSDIKRLDQFESRLQSVINARRQKAIDKHLNTYEKIKTRGKYDQRVAQDEFNRQKDENLAAYRQKAQVIALKVPGEKKEKGFELLWDWYQGEDARAGQEFETKKQEVAGWIRSSYQTADAVKQRAFETFDHWQERLDGYVKERRGKIEDQYAAAKLKAQERKRLLARKFVEDSKASRDVETFIRQTSEPLTLADVERQMGNELDDLGWQKDQKIFAAERKRKKSMSWMNIRKSSALRPAIADDQRGFYTIPFLKQVREHSEEVERDLKLLDL